MQSATNYIFTTPFVLHIFLSTPHHSSLNHPPDACIFKIFRYHKSTSILFVINLLKGIPPMTKREALRALRMALLALYDNPTTIRRLLDDAGVSTGQINFQGAIQDIWYNVITETERQEQIHALMGAIDEPYQKNAALQQAYGAYQAAEQGCTVDRPSATTRSDTQAGSTIINLGGGTYIAGNVNTGGGDFVGRDKK